MPNSKQIVYLSQSQYAELIANGSITVDGVTVTYNENDIYVTPQAEPVTDVRINGASVAANGVADIPVASSTTLGVMKVYHGDGVVINTSNNSLQINPPLDTQIKSGNSGLRPIVAGQQHQSTFYGLAKAAGHDEASSTEPLGTYTPEAKGAIQSMLGVSDLIATEENNLVASKAYAIGDVFTANGKLYKATAAIAVDGAIITDGANANCEETNVGEGFVKKTDVATSTNPGVVKIQSGYGLQMFEGIACISQATSDIIKSGTNYLKAITPNHQHEATFYGLAKAAGADEKDSTLPVGQYTDTAKTAIRSMLGATSSNVIAIQDTQPTDSDTKIWLPETAETPVEVPTVAEMEQALAGKVGFEDYASENDAGVVKILPANGIYLDTNKQLAINYPTDNQIKTGSAYFRPIVPALQEKSVFYGLAKAAGDTTQAVSNNAVGTYTNEAKTAIRTMLGVVGDVQVNGTSVVQNNIATIPLATNSTPGLVFTEPAAGLDINSNGKMYIAAAATAKIKAGINETSAIVPKYQHEATFYGLAKAAGDTTQSTSSNTVGDYTPEAKAAIWEMLGLDGSAFIKSDWELIRDDTFTNEEQADYIITEDKNGNPFELTDVIFMFELPKQSNAASKMTWGQVWFYYNGTSNYFAPEPGQWTQEADAAAHGFIMYLHQHDGMMFVERSSQTSTSNNGNIGWRYMSGLTSKSNGIFILDSDLYIDKINIKTVTGTGHYRIFGKHKRYSMDSAIVKISSTAPTITALPGHRYVCGEVTSLNITLPTSGCVDILFESGSTPAILTVPNTVKWPEWFDPNNLETNCIYEINIMDGKYGVVTTWLMS